MAGDPRCTDDSRPGNKALIEPVTLDSILGSSPALLAQIQLARQFAADPEHLPVRIYGETGTGKELFAHAIHALSDRRGAPFVPINCAVIPAPLVENEMFGHGRGAFTGAGQARDGLVQLAQGGTLFLDDVDTIPAEMQPKLLRLLDKGEFRPVGEAKHRLADIRLVCATNRRLRDEVKAKRFREDLYYRINVLQINLPPLRERLGDIPVLAEAILRARNLREQPCSTDSPTEFSPEALGRLCSHHWPGNVRELQNVIRRAAASCKGGVIEADHLRFDSLSTGSLTEVESYSQAKAQFDTDFYERLLARYGGNVARAARASGKSRSTLYHFLRKIKERGRALLAGR